MKTPSIATIMVTDNGDRYRASQVLVSKDPGGDVSKRVYLVVVPEARGGLRPASLSDKAVMDPPDTMDPLVALVNYLVKNEIRVVSAEISVNS